MTTTHPILHLTLVRQWFDDIASGKKTEEYRQIKPHWTSRLLTKPSNYDGMREFRKYDEVHFRNGYSPLAPFMRVEFKGITYCDHGAYGHCYAIQLGKVLEIRNWDRRAADFRRIARKHTARLADSIYSKLTS